MARVDADVIVIGAGPGGCAAAVPLLDAGIDVLTIERHAFAPEPDIASGEVLAPLSQMECRGLGVALEGDWVHNRFFGVRNVYPDLSWTFHRFPEGFSYVHVDRGGFNGALRARIAAAGGRVQCDARVTDIDVTADRAKVRTDGGDEWSARLVVDASGRSSPVLRKRGLKADDPEFRQLAVALFFSSWADAYDGAWDRHLYGHHGAMISGAEIHPGLYRYILEADLADKQEAGRKPIEFYEQIAEQFDPWIHERIHTHERVGHWSMAPLAYRVAAIAADRLLLVGDAAGYLSPLTGQGCEFALRSGRLAAAAALAALRADDLSAGAFTAYVDDHRAQVAAGVELVRQQLRVLRDQEALLAAATDDDARVGCFGPFFGPVADRGTLR